MEREEGRGRDMPEDAEQRREQEKSGRLWRLKIRYLKALPLLYGAATDRIGVTGSQQTNIVVVYFRTLKTSRWLVVANSL